MRETIPAKVKDLILFIKCHVTFMRWNNLQVGEKKCSPGKKIYMPSFICLGLDTASTKFTVSQIHNFTQLKTPASS
jgi:hypothetical protein